MSGENRDALTPAGLDHALSWLERNLDELTDAARRQGEAIRRDTAAAPPSERQPVSPEAALAAFEALESSKSGASAGRSAGAQPDARSAVTPASIVPTASVTPLLDSLGRDLTALAARGELSPIIGREAEINSVVEILARSTKRNPVLLGPVGAGKTAIVEGLAQRIAIGDVPSVIKGTRIVEIPLASLVAGTSYRGQLEERLQSLVKEASRPDVVLFFDEIHLLAGAGRSEGGMGADQVFKPALARGDIAVIGATTAEEYHDSVEKDDALARRFTTIAINELTAAETRPILRSVRDQLAKSRGVTVSDEAIDVLLDFAERRIANRRFPDKAIDLLEQAVAEAIVAGRETVGRDDALATDRTWEERASSTPTLDRYGRNLVSLARSGSLGPVIGREREIDSVAETLLRQTKRNPLLLGPAGCGKTAIVEGLALRIAEGTVPKALAEVRIFDVPIAQLAGAADRNPSLLRDFLSEARHPSVVVFFDEIHQLGSPASRVMAETLKPALARGDLACIGATTGAEYQAYIEPEAALARRFSPIQIEPMDEAGVRNVLKGVRDSLARKRGVAVSDEALDELVELAGTHMPGRSFPDKGVDLLEQAVVYALVRGATSVDVAMARASTAAFLGLDLDPRASIEALADAIRERSLLDADAAAALIDRLGVTLRGLDSDAARPDAVVLLAGEASAGAEVLATACAEALFGRATARISIDLSGMTEDSSISSLLGSAPGLVGSDRTLPLHELRRSPRQVLLLRGIDRCAPAVRQTIGAGLAAGSLTDAMGRLIPLGSAVVILVAPDLQVSGRSELEAWLGSELLAICDVVAIAAIGGRRPDSAWIQAELLEPLARRLSRSGFEIRFDPAFVSWLADRLAAAGDSPAAILDRDVTPTLLASLRGAADGSRWLAVVDGDRPRLTPDEGPS